MDNLQTLPMDDVDLACARVTEAAASLEGSPIAITEPSEDFD